MNLMDPFKEELLDIDNPGMRERTAKVQNLYENTLELSHNENISHPFNAKFGKLHNLTLEELPASQDVSILF